MRRLIAAIALLMMMIGAAPLAAQDAQNVAGTWNGTFTRGTGKEEFSMVITQDGEKVTGTLSSKVLSGTTKQSTNVGKEREDVKVVGTCVGNKLSLKVGKQDSIEGTVAGDVLTGQAVTTNGAPRVVSATKAK